MPIDPCLLGRQDADSLGGSGDTGGTQVRQEQLQPHPEYETAFTIEYHHRNNTIFIIQLYYNYSNNKPASSLLFKCI